MNFTSNFPKAFDNEKNLFAVSDALKLLLAYDYHPGQKQIYVEGEQRVFDKFPETGIITLIDQVSDKDKRSLSFYYGGKDKMMFTGISLMSGQKDCFKPKIETTVTQNVMASHRTVLVDAILAIEAYIGPKGTTDPEPFGKTIIGRLNYIRKVILSPKAWFTADNNIGIVPATITFTTEGAPTDGGKALYEWDFGDGTAQTTGEAQVEKTYQKPGYYDVTLKITNDFGSHTVNFPKMIKIKAHSPDKAVIEFVPGPGQILKEGVLRTPINKLVVTQVKEGKSGNKSFAGELFGKTGPIDPVSNYTWNMLDDLPHHNNRKTKAVYSVGGTYDINLRTDTEFGSYRITNMEKCIDVVEDINLWLWNRNEAQDAQVFEFGLLSQTFKTRPTSKLGVCTDSSFLSDKTAIKEFKKNTGFIKRNKSSGQGGTCLLCWASGRSPTDPPSSEKIQLAEYNGFTDTYTTHPAIPRPWNWAVLPGNENLYFILGDNGETKPANHSPTKQLKTIVNLATLSVTNQPMTFGHYKSSAQELMQNTVAYDSEGEPRQGHFSVYRTAWKNMTGYILRNKPGEYAHLKSFYKTEGTIGDPFKTLRKLPDMDGKSEGQLVPMANGVFCFDNTGTVSAYNDNTATWEVADANLTVASFSSLQNRKVAGFDNAANTLLAVSDGYTKAYLSYDYNPNAFIRFNAVDLTFHSVGHRPQGMQWLMGIY